MTSRHEAALDAILSALAPLAAQVMREEDLPVFCPPEGLVNLVPEDPEEEGQQLGTGIREWSRPVELECVVQAAEGPARAAALDMLLSQVAALLLADRSLGGMVSWLEPGAPQASDTVPMEGAESLKGAVLPVTLYYETPQNPME